MTKDALKQILDAMRLHTAETHPLVETERAMEVIEAALAQPAQEPIRREQQLFMDEQELHASPTQRKPITEDRLTEMFGGVIEVAVFSVVARMVEEEHGIKEQS